MVERTFGIVYATGSKMVRRIIVPDDPAMLHNGTHRVGPGETMLVVTGRHDLESCEAHVKDATGVMPPRLVCAVVNARNTITDLICADPEIDTLPDATMVHAYSPDVEIGGTYDPVERRFRRIDGRIV